MSHDELGPLRDERGRYLRLPPTIKKYAWKKGVSPNPQGHSGLYGQTVKLAREASLQAMRRLIELIDSDDERVALTAANAVIERGFGRPQNYDPTKEKPKIDFNPADFTREQRQQI